MAGRPPIWSLSAGRALRTYFFLALVLVGLTLVFDRLAPTIGPPLLVPYLVVIAVAARLGGLGAAIFAGLASVPLVDFFLFEPQSVLEVSPRRLIHLVLVMLAGLVFGWLMDGLRFTRTRAEAAAEAERAALQERDALLSVIAHDLRSPLTAIKARVQLAGLALARDPPDAESAQRSLDQVLPQVERINRLLDDLLATGRTDGGTLSVKLTPLDLKPLLGQVAERWRADAPSNAIELVADTPLPVLGDADRLQQILDNLIANAVKYSPPGAPIRMRGGIDGAEVRVSIADRGDGIPPTEQPFIFERFYRRPEHRAGRQPGLGLGLYITRELVQAHRGSISVESEVGRGSTFHVTLPLLTEPLESPEATETTDAGQAGAPESSQPKPETPPA